MLELASAAALLLVATAAIAGDVDLPFLRGNAEALGLMVLFAVLGGIAQYSVKIRARKAIFSMAELVGEMVISISAGTTTGLVALDHGASLPMVLAVTSAGGHMGARVFHLVDRVISAQLRKRFGLDVDEIDPDPPTS